MNVFIGCLGVGAVFAVGCMSGAPVPADKLARSEAAVRSAQEMGAERSTAGAQYLQAAQTEYREGKRLVIDGDQARATVFLLRAEADAELAMNLTRESSALEDVQKTRNEIRDLKLSMNKEGR